MISTEKVVEMPIVNPETGGVSRSFRFLGIVDELDEKDSRVTDWKGVANPVDFIAKQRIGYQAERYILCLLHEGKIVRKIDYRLISRPTIKYNKPRSTFAVMKEGRKTAVSTHDTIEEAQKAMSDLFIKDTKKLSEKKKKHAEKVEKKLTAYKVKLKKENKDDVAGTFFEPEPFVFEPFEAEPLPSYSIGERIAGDATRAAYEDRCVEWLRQDGKVIPHEYFVNSKKLEQARWSIWDATKRILECRQHDRWLTNDQACMDWGRPCQYAGLCDAVQNGADFEFLIEEQFHPAQRNPELDGKIDTEEAATKLPILTHSMCQALTRCEMYFYWRYERAIIQGKEEGEALWIGSAIHAALDAINKDGMDAGFPAIDNWANKNPVLGEDAWWIQDQNIARARAMVRVALERWSKNPNDKPASTNGQAEASDKGMVESEGMHSERLLGLD